jgi:hypothetical protein
MARCDDNASENLDVLWLDLDGDCGGAGGGYG